MNIEKLYRSYIILGRESMKKLIVTIFLVQILIIGVWGIASNKWSLGEAFAVDKETGILIKQDTPENALTSYYELMSRKRYEQVRNLTTPISRKSVDIKTMTDMIKKTRMENAVLEKIFPANVDGDLAVVGYVRSATLEGKVFMVGLAVYKINDNRWEKIEQASELKIDELEKVIKSAIKVEDVMLAAKKDNYGIADLTKEQVKMITDQVSAMLANHKQSLVQLQEMKKQQQQPAAQAPATK